MCFRSIFLTARWIAIALLAIAAGSRSFAADTADVGGATRSAEGNSVVVRAEDVTTKISLSDGQSQAGRRLAVVATFEVGPGWHIYGAPLPPEYTVTQIKFADDLIESQSVKFPPPTPVKFEALGQTFPVYRGAFKAAGNIVLKPQLQPGEHQLAGTVEFQECNDLECKIPQSVTFTLPLKINPTVSSAPKA